MAKFTRPWKGLAHQLGRHLAGSLSLHSPLPLPGQLVSSLLERPKTGSDVEICKFQARAGLRGQRGNLRTFMSQEVVFRLHMGVPGCACRGNPAPSLDVCVPPRRHCSLGVCRQVWTGWGGPCKQTWWCTCDRPHVPSQTAWVQKPAVPQISCVI